VTTTVVPPIGPDAGQATAHWIEVNTTNLSWLTLADHGNVGGEDIAQDTYTFFPSIAVNSSGSVGIGFSASASTIYAGAYYTGRCINTPPGSVQASQVLAEGMDWYVRTFEGTRNRWGDYSGMCVDPSDDLTFWVFNEYAVTRGTPISGGDGRWGTRWGKFTVDCQSEIVFDFLTGWNIISCPGDPIISDFATMFQQPIDDGVMSSVVYGWNDDTQDFGQAFTCEFGHSYWVFVLESCSVPVEYMPRCTMVRNLEPFWGMIGSALCRWNTCQDAPWYVIWNHSGG
jgi:hypothetical protein